MFPHIFPWQTNYHLPECSSIYLCLLCSLHKYLSLSFGVSNSTGAFAAAEMAVSRSQGSLNYVTEGWPCSRDEYDLDELINRGSTSTVFKACFTSIWKSVLFLGGS